jgi:hypothetical protein
VDVESGEFVGVGEGEGSLRGGLVGVGGGVCVVVGVGEMEGVGVG